MEEKKKLCRYFNANRACRFGNRCTFLHLSNNLVGCDKSNDEKKLCKHWDSNGKCHYDKRCKFLHPPLCKFWNGLTGSCRKDDKCSYYHCGLVEASNSDSSSRYDESQQSYYTNNYDDNESDNGEGSYDDQYSQYSPDEFPNSYDDDDENSENDSSMYQWIPYDPSQAQSNIFTSQPDRSITQQKTAEEKKETDGDNDEEKIDPNCIVCMVRPKRYIFDKCKHLCVCLTCAEAIDKSTQACPICRTKGTYSKVYM